MDDEAIRVHTEGFGEADASSDEDRARRQYEDRAVRCIRTTIQAYRSHERARDGTDLGYYRGQNWADTDGAASPLVGGTAPAQRSTQDEIYPAIDAMKSAMSMADPQTSASDRRYNKKLDPATFRKERMVASTLCWFSDKDHYGKAVTAANVNAMVFNRGGIYKGFPDVASGLIRWRILEPWEVFFDPRAKRLEDAGWSVERTPIEYDDFKQRSAEGMYIKPEKEVKGDVVTMQLDQQGQEQMLRQDAAILQQQPWQEVMIWEWRDYRRGVLLHIVAQTGEVVLREKIAYGMPYRILIFDSAIGSTAGISIVDRMVTLQRDINELSNVRLEVARRNFDKLFVLRELFASDDEYNEWLRARPWEPCRINKPDTLNTVAEGFYRQEAPRLSNDFHTDVAQRVEHARFITGAGAFRQKAGFRTAEEVTAVTGNMDTRMEARMTAVIGVVTEMFELTLNILRWMLQGVGTPGFDYDPMIVFRETQGEGVTYEEWRDAILTSSAWFKLEPFAPLMENAQTRRAALVQILQAIGGNEALAQCINWGVIAEEIVRLYKFNPDAATEPPPPAEGGAGGPAVPGQAGPEMMPPLPGAPPSADLSSLMGSAGPVGGLDGVSPQG